VDQEKAKMKEMEHKRKEEIDKVFANCYSVREFETKGISETSKSKIIKTRSSWKRS